MNRMMKTTGAIALVTCGYLVGTSTSQPELTEQQQREMEQKWMEAMTPGEAHERIVKSAGTWHAKIRYMMDPAMGWQETEGTMRNTSILGGRWVRQDFEGDFGGMPYQGLGYIGYDNMTGEYISTWCDNMSTGLMVMKGTYDAANKTYEFKGEFNDAVMGKGKQRDVVRVLGDDAEVMEMYQTLPGQPERLVMEMTYTRER
ncbi:MAG: DUF1579 domain-containing protein [Phycisphaerales bacterium]|nr:DUF1579 domain-containing protein [Phycisphaerales bacterium]